jgi:protein SCO1
MTSDARNVAGPTPTRISTARALVMIGVAVSMLLIAVGVGRQADDRRPLRAWSAAPAELRPILWPEAKAVAEFALVDQHEKPFTQADLLGRWSFVFFGYLECPDVCPTTLHVMRELRSTLLATDRRDNAYQFIFVTVDPIRDTPSRIRPYLGHFDSTFIGLSGAPEELDRLTLSLAIKYVEVFSDDGAVRSIDHTSSLLVVDPKGRVTAAFPPPHRPEQMRAQFHALRRYTGM